MSYALQNVQIECENRLIHSSQITKSPILKKAELDKNHSD